MAPSFRAQDGATRSLAAQDESISDHDLDLDPSAEQGNGVDDVVATEQADEGANADEQHTDVQLAYLRWQSSMKLRSAWERIFARVAERRERGTSQVKADDVLGTQRPASPRSPLGAPSDASLLTLMADWQPRQRIAPPISGNAEDDEDIQAFLAADAQLQSRGDSREASLVQALDGEQNETEELNDEEDEEEDVVDFSQPGWEDAIRGKRQRSHAASPNSSTTAPLIESLATAYSDEWDSGTSDSDSFEVGSPQTEGHSAFEYVMKLFGIKDVSPKVEPAEAPRGVALGQPINKNFPSPKGALERPDSHSHHQYESDVPHSSGVQGVTHTKSKRRSSSSTSSDSYDLSSNAAASSSPLEQRKRAAAKRKRPASPVVAKSLKPPSPGQGSRTRQIGTDKSSDGASQMQTPAREAGSSGRAYAADTPRSQQQLPQLSCGGPGQCAKSFCLMCGTFRTGFSSPSPTPTRRRAA